MIGEPVRSTSAWLAGWLDFNAEDLALFECAMAELQADGSIRRIRSHDGR